MILGSLKSIWDDRVPLSVDTLTEDDQFDIASCQFAMHYMFQSKQKANHFFQQVSNHLKSGGELIAVTMDSRVIAEELLNDLHGVFDGFTDDGVLLPTADDDTNDDDEEDKDAVDDNNDGSSNKGIKKYKKMDTTSSKMEENKDEEDAFRQIILSINRDNNKHIASTEKILSFRNDLGYLLLQIKFSNHMYNKLLRYHNASSSSSSSSSSSISSSSSSSSKKCLSNMTKNANESSTYSWNNESSTESASSITPLSEEDSMYGIQYTFTLKDSDAEAAVDAPEWCVTKKKKEI